MGVRGSRTGLFLGGERGKESTMALRLAEKRKGGVGGQMLGRGRVDYKNDIKALTLHLCVCVCVCVRERERERERERRQRASERENARARGKERVRKTGE